MDIALGAEDLAFREEVRAFLDEKLTPEIREEAARMAGVWAEGDLSRRWHRILYDQGWVAPAWPKEYGGPGWSVVQQYIFETECAAAGAPVIPIMGLRMCGPVLMEFGTKEQKDFFLPRILSGEHYWCQGYSEPGAGSDLAALKCRAVADGGDYIVDGSKIWTTHAQFANWIFCLVRTNTEIKPQAGISFLLIDMATPGIDVRPILSISGDHEVNQVFFDSVRVPQSNLVGGENNGWTVAKYLLEFERGGAYAAQMRKMLAGIRRIAAAEMMSGGRLIDDPDFAAKLASLEIAVDAIDMTERRFISAISTGGSPGAATSSALKLAGSETLQLVTELAVEAVGHYAAPDYTNAREGKANWWPGNEYDIPVMAKYLNTRAATIYGGSSEIQRNILAKVALGL